MSDLSGRPIHGSITAGLETGTLVRQTIGFVRSQLPRWRDDPDREVVDAEEALNGQLCKFLNVVARSEFPMAHFHHEERQAERRRVDISAMPASNILIGHTKYEPFLVIEGKRLPAPSSDRQREYAGRSHHKWLSEQDLFEVSIVPGGGEAFVLDTDL